MSTNTPSDLLIGYGALVISCFGFTTMFVPLKYVECKDGFFVQWVECAVVLVIGFIVNIIRGFPEFQWIAAIGGALYATGNVFSVPIVNGLGMGLGLLIWGSMQVVVGWSVARFGLFSWLSPHKATHDELNYIGLILTIISGVLFVFVRRINTEAPTSEESSDEETTTESEERKTLSVSYVAQKIPYIIMAIGLAVLHGLMMTPLDILKQKYPSDDKFAVFNYVWSFYSTVFVLSTLYFFAYCVIMRKKAYVEANLVLPSVLYGVLWSIGMTFWFLSANRLSQVVTYPITTRLPAIGSALIEVFIFKTITGRRNLLFLAFACTVGMCGVILIALSNQQF